LHILDEKLEEKIEGRIDEKISLCRKIKKENNLNKHKTSSN